MTSVNVRRYVDPSYTARILVLLYSYVDKNTLIEPEELYLNKALVDNFKPRYHILRWSLHRPGTISQ
ncbi:MAG: hypothetical protein QXV48_02180 [Desulfurococcaceae archaeon]